MKREAPSNSKMKKLCRLLDIPLYQAVGLLELLWHLTAREAPRGDIGKLSNEDIALALDYRQDEDRLIDALIRTHWIDESEEYRLIIHDWQEHADEAVKKRLTRSGQSFVMSRHVETKRPSVETKRPNGKLPRAGAGPEPEPGAEPDKRLTAAPLSACADEPGPGPEPEPEPGPGPGPKKIKTKAMSPGGDDRPSFSKSQLPKAEQQLLEYAEIWNANCDPLPRVRIDALATPRSERFRKRCAKLGKRIKNGLTPEKFLEAVRKATESPFCTGKYTGWQASFDFLISDEGLKNTQAGKYDHADKPPKPVRTAMEDLEESFR